MKRDTKIEVIIRVSGFINQSVNPPFCCSANAFASASRDLASSSSMLLPICTICSSLSASWLRISAKSLFTESRLSNTRWFSLRILWTLRIDSANCCRICWNWRFCSSSMAPKRFSMISFVSSRSSLLAKVLLALTPALLLASSPPKLSNWLS